MRVYLLNTLSNDNLLNRTKFKANANYKSNIFKMMVSVLDRMENLVGRGENAGFQDQAACFVQPDLDLCWPQSQMYL